MRQVLEPKVPGSSPGPGFFFLPKILKFLFIEFRPYMGKIFNCSCIFILSSIDTTSQLVDRAVTDFAVPLLVISLIKSLQINTRDGRDAIYRIAISHRIADF